MSAYVTEFDVEKVILQVERVIQVEKVIQVKIVIDFERVIRDKRINQVLWVE